MVRVGALLFVVAIQSATLDVSGGWTLELLPDLSGHNDSLRCTAQQDGRALSLNCRGAQMSGTVDGRNVSFSLKTGARQELTIAFTGTLNDTETAVAGTWRLMGGADDEKKGEFTLTKR